MELAGEIWIEKINRVIEGRQKNSETRRNINAPEVKKNHFWRLETEQGQQVQRSWGESKSHIFQEKRKMTPCVAIVDKTTELENSLR